MKFLYDFFPIFLFFIAYKMYDIYVATAVAITASFAQVFTYWLKHRRFEKMHLVTLALLIFFGGATLIFRDDTFIKWKPTVLNWLFAVAFLGSQYVGKQTIVQRMMGKNIHLPDHLWPRLNISWVGFFVFSGVANLYVAFNFDTDTWVNFKLFGMMGLTLAFVFIQAIFLGRYVTPEADSTE